jgi:tRNA(fMet)-specific endonuclease VapC
MSTRYLLDTSILILVLKKDTTARHKIVAIGTENAYVTSISLGELYYGAEHSTQIERNRAEVEELQRLSAILLVDAATARIYGLLKHQQRMKGLLLPENDLWIAATAVQYGLTLVARDQHFRWVDGLALEQW